jgi:cellulose biosynthesis protein BcsQ
VKVIASYAIKGGVGKTAAAVNLAYCAAREGARTILCDIDPQGSATYYFRVKPPRRLSPKRLIKGGHRLESRIRGTDYDNLDLLPASMSYRNLDIALSAVKRSRSRLRKSLLGIGDPYDYVFLDCPPSITLVAENVLRMADRILVPLVPTTLSLLSYRKLVAFFAESGLDATRLFAFFSMMEPRKRLHRDTMAYVSDRDERVLRSVIPYLSDVERMGVERAPVVYSRPRSVAAQSYINLWDELKGLL